MSRRNRIGRARKAGLKHQGSLEKVLDEIGQTRLEKCSQYGESRYENHSASFNRWMAFSDVHRKYIRLEQLSTSGELAALRETYMDLAAYAAMAVQLIDMGRMNDV